MNHEAGNQPIPEIFCQLESKTPFDRCALCQCALDEKHYVVEKVIRNYVSLNTQEVIFEYAMCLACAENMRMELSEESRQKVEAYFSAHVDLVKRNDRIKQLQGQPLGQWISRCLIKDQMVQQSTSYSIYALCKGHELIPSDLPYAICEEAQDEIMQLLSAKSLEILDDFMGRHFSGPPEVAEILKRRPVFF